MDNGSSWVLAPLQILFVDLLLGADNALVIALACRALPPKQINQAAALGVLGAMVLRLLLVIGATSLLVLPFVKLIGAFALLMIAMNLAAGEDLAGDFASASPATSLIAAAWIIIIADAAMSFDNVVAIAAIAGGNYLWLAIGVGLSLPVLGFGGVMLANLLARAPYLVEFGAALLGWLAGGMATTDPLVFPWASANAPALVAFAPAFGAAFVFIYGRWVARPKREAARAPRLETPEPPPRPAPAARPAPPPQREVAAPAPKLAAPLEVEAPPARLDPLADTRPEPVDIHEPDPEPKSGSELVAIIALIGLAVVAGAILAFASFMDAFN